MPKILHLDPAPVWTTLIVIVLWICKGSHHFKPNTSISFWHIAALLLALLAAWIAAGHADNGLDLVALLVIVILVVILTRTSNCYLVAGGGVGVHSV